MEVIDKKFRFRMVVILRKGGRGGNERGIERFI